MTNVKFFDRILPDVDFQSFHAFARDVARQKSRYGTSIWQDNDENPSETRETYFYSPKSRSLKALLPAGVTLEDVEKLGDVRICPTSTPIDDVFREVAERANEITELVGRVDEDWIGLIAKVYAYPKGSKATWHTDAGPYAGAFVYYAHHEWHRDWGGQFLYCDPAASREETPSEGRFVAPLPNRLLVLRGGTLHTVANVSQAAGANLRLSMAGFFVKPDGITQLILEAMAARRRCEPPGRGADSHVTTAPRERMK